MLDADPLARLRCAAGLLLRAPDTALRCVDGDRTVLEVMPPPLRSRDHHTVPVCWFRALLSGVRAGTAPPEHRRVAMQLSRTRLCLGTRLATEPLASGAVRVDEISTWRYLLAVPLDAEVVTAVADDPSTDIVDATGASLELLADPVLGVTVLDLSAPKATLPVDVALDVLHGMAARAAVEQLERELNVRAAHPATGGVTPSDHPGMG